MADPFVIVVILPQARRLCKRLFREIAANEFNSLVEGPACCADTESFDEPRKTVTAQGSLGNSCDYHCYIIVHHPCRIISTRLRHEPL